MFVPRCLFSKVSTNRVTKTVDNRDSPYILKSLYKLIFNVFNRPIDTVMYQTILKSGVDYIRRPPPPSPHLSSVEHHENLPCSRVPYRGGVRPLPPGFYFTFFFQCYSLLFRLIFFFPFVENCS